MYGGCDMDFKTLKKKTMSDFIVNRHMQQLDDEALSVIRDALTEHYMQWSEKELWDQYLILRKEEDQHA